MSGHSEGTRVSKFCALRTDKCSPPCTSNPPSEYRENGKPEWVEWAALMPTPGDPQRTALTFIQGSKKKVTKDYEAHHLLCVACVTEMLAGEAKLREILEQTEWCINAKKNMLGMPLWGHTLQWYCDLAAGGELLENVAAPRFENVPQHDYDHNSKEGYTKEVKRSLATLAEKVAKSTDKHEEVAGTLKHDLEDLSDVYRDKLSNRGMRSGGTHNAWKKGSEHPDSDWYLPFSMANTGSAEKRTFPAPNIDSKVASKIKRLAAALLNWGAT